MPKIQFVGHYQKDRVNVVYMARDLCKLNGVII